MSLTPVFSDDLVTLYLGDCLDVLRGMPADSIDAIVTDPPAAVRFMGREWDSDRGGRAQWVAWLAERMSEALRVLKPGGHLLVWSLPRTSHWTAWALEDAGLEIRDCILHLFGSGFPKSLDVSKAIDKTRRRDYVQAAVRLGMEIPGRNLDDWTKEDHSPGDKWWAEFKAHLSAEQWGAIEREVTGSGKSGAASVAYVREVSGEYDITAPATEDAARWEGWGTALKPGQEIWWLARKPLKGTVAGNVLEFGTGALNIAGARVTAAGQGREQPTSQDAAGSSRAGSTSRTSPSPEDDRTSRILSTQRPVSSVPPLADRNDLPASALADVTDCLLSPDSPAGCPTSPCSCDGHAQSAAGDAQASAQPQSDAAGPVGPHAICRHIPQSQSMPPAHSTTLDVEREPSRAGEASSETRYADRGGTDFAPLPGVRGGDPLGRWPANVVFTHSAACDGVCAPDCPAGELDRQSGVSTSGSRKAGTYGLMGYGGHNAVPMPEVNGDTGGASRFYPVFRYQAKAPASERPRLEDGTAHETVKPLGLMAWLVRLITPPGGTVLDLFAGSGPVAEACIIEGFRCVLIEQDPKSARLIRKRLSKPIQPVMFGLEG